MRSWLQPESSHFGRLLERTHTARNASPDCLDESSGQVIMTDHAVSMSAEPSQPVEVAVAAAWPPADWCDVHVVLAVSGGPDSVALLRAVTGSNCKRVVADACLSPI